MTKALLRNALRNANKVRNHAFKNFRGAQEIKADVGGNQAKLS